MRVATCSRSRQISCHCFSGQEPSCFQAPEASLSSLCWPSAHKPRERLTANPLKRCADKWTRTTTKPESEAERGRGQTLIMAGPWLDMLWKVTVDESSIIYSITEQGYLFFQQHEQQGIMAQNKQPVVAYPCDCQKTVRRFQWWRRLWLLVVAWRRHPGRDSPWLLLTPSLSLPLFLFHVKDMRGQCQLCTGQNNVAA